MQTIATKIFIVASVMFGVVGIVMILTIPSNWDGVSGFGTILRKILLVDVCVILPSFALAVAGKYLNK